MNDMKYYWKYLILYQVEIFDNEFYIYIFEFNFSSIIEILKKLC